VRKDQRGDLSVDGLTELAALEQRMQLKENLPALGELSAGIAHEFKKMRCDDLGLRADDPVGVIPRQRL